MIKNKKIAALVAATALALGLPAAAHADNYSPGTNNQEFTTSQGGWVSGGSASGLCLPALLCPAVFNNFVGGGGASGDGYIRTQFVSLASTLAGTSVGVWQSPGFVYHGNNGNVPASVSLDLDIRPQISALLGVSLLNDSSYRVDVVDAATGTKINAVPQTALVNDSGWTAVPTAHISPALLKLNHQYDIQITTTYHAVATVVATGEVGYDDVRLTTSGTDDNGNGHNGTNGTNGGSGITSLHQLRLLALHQGLPGSAKVVGNRLRVKVACPKLAAPLSCHYALMGLSKARGSKLATNRKTVVVKPGHSRTVQLTILPKYRAQLRHAHHMVLRAKLRVGMLSVFVVKRVKVTH